MNKFSIICARTERSKAYIQMLCMNDIYPAQVYILHDRSRCLPGSSDSVSNIYNGIDFKESIEETCKKFRLHCVITEDVDIHSNENISTISSMPGDFIVYSGYGGVILKNSLLDCGKKFIHVHPGLLPQFRGSTTIYYSILKEQSCGASAIILNSQIDYGTVLGARSFPIPDDGEIIDYYYDPYIRSLLLVDVMKTIVQTGIQNPIVQGQDDENTYFIIHPVLKHLAILSCKNNE